MLDLAKAKKHLRVESESDDTLIQTYLDASIAAVEGLTGHILVEREVRQSLDHLHGNGRGEIELAWRPVLGVDRIEYVDSNGAAQQLLLASNAFRFIDGTNPYVAPVFNGSWPSLAHQRNAATIVYDAGYSDLGIPLPADLEAAVLLMVGHLYMNREAVTDGNVREVPMGVKSITNRYRPTI